MNKQTTVKLNSSSRMTIFTNPKQHINDLFLLNVICFVVQQLKCFISYRECCCYVTNDKFYQHTNEISSMIESAKEKGTKERAAAEEGKDIRMEDLVLLCDLVARVGKR